MEHFDYDGNEMSTLIEKGIKPLVEKMHNTGLRAAERIYNKLDLEGEHSYLLPYFAPGYSERSIWLTDRPNKVFGANNKVFTITSSLVLQQGIEDGIILLPAAEQDGFHGQISSHRGIGLSIFSRLMKDLGFTLGAKDSFVWLGPEVDIEQFVIEDDIARKGTEVDIKIATLIFSHSDISQESGRLELNPKLMRVLSFLGTGKNLYESEPESREYIETLLETLHKYTGVREGWFNALEGLLKGTIPPKMRFNPAVFESRMLFAANHLVQPSSGESNAIVLEINMKRLLDDIPIFPFPMTSRPPDTIIPTPFAKLSHVDVVYAEKGKLDGLVKTGKFPEIRDISDLPEEVCLRDKDGRHVTPDVVRRVGIDPRKPMCALRYNRNPVGIWANHIRNGDIAPIFSQQYLELCVPQDEIELAVKKIALGMIGHSGLTRTVRGMLNGNKNRAETRILGDIGLRLEIPSVRTDFQKRM